MPLPSSTIALKVRCVQPMATLATRQRRTLASRSLAQTFLPLPELQWIWHAILGVTGVDQLWPEENTDDKDSRQEGMFPCHTRRTLQARRQRFRRCIDKISAGLSPDDIEETSVCGGGAQRAGSTAESYRGAVHSFIKWADSHDLALVEDDDDDRAFCSFVTKLFVGKGGRRFQKGIDVSGPSVFSHWDAWHSAGSALSEWLPESSMGWIDTGSVSTRVGANVNDDDSVGLSGYLRPSEMYNLQGGDIQAPALGMTTQCSLLRFPKARPQSSSVGI